MARHVVGLAEEIGEGETRRFMAGARAIAVFNVKGEFLAIADKCPHAGASLCQGKRIGLSEWTGPGEFQLSRAGEFIRCPWHGWEFDLRTGKSICDPLRTRARSYEVSVVSGETLEDQQLEVETFPVTLNGRYLVVEV